VRKLQSKTLKRDIKNSVTSGEQVSLEELNLNDGGRHIEDSEMYFDDENLKLNKVLYLLKASDIIKTDEFLRSKQG
jgi:hypothetical protein